MTEPAAVFEDEHRELLDSFGAFVRRELAPLAAELGEAGHPSYDLCSYVRQRSAQLGFYAGDYPESLGGSGMPFSAVVALNHVAGRTGCRLAPYALAGSEGPSPLLLGGTDAQVKRYLEPLVRGQRTRCLALTEPDAGSDAFRLSTTARRVDGGWVISGRKTFVSNAARADLVLVVAAVDTPAGHRRPAVFVLEQGHPGMRLGQRYEGMSGEVLHELVLDAAEVPDDALLGDPTEPDALGASIGSLSRGRLMVAAQCNGIAEYALSLGVEYARHRRAFGRPIGDYQHVQEHLVTSRAELEASKVLTLACARLVDAGVEPPENAALAKLTASTMAVRVVDRALQVHGATGWVRGHPLEFLYRQVRTMTIIEGTTEIQKVIIAGAMGLG
ncbi:acyl-CoA dehydrogenase family protein [Micromonospora echinospora]|uniref:acyl-CoA dehydrogenase family protein n=1 Tax=Micromonospora echinospora TaxID=1877 RepID=UPI003673252A